jgi:putative AbiEii toxin of type IV toxin-antitoxin system/uncharacterized protein DUF3696
MTIRVSASKFRCFDVVEDIVLAPLTILVGENSTGKSSFLALIRYLFETTFGGVPPSFNKEPFFLGSFEQIAFNPSGQHGRATSIDFELTNRFDVGGVRDAFHESDFGDNAPNEIKYAGKLRNIASQAHLSAARITFGRTDINADFIKNSARVRFSNIDYTLELPQSREELSIDLPGGLRHLPVYLYANLMAAAPSGDSSEVIKRALAAAMQFSESMTLMERFRVYASAPVRTEPQRTYNPVDQSPTPDGRHVLNMLASLKRTRAEKWKKLKQDIDRFGNLGGLFRSFDIRLLGTRESDPFQAQVRIAGIASNIIDVGYGVSQVIPIVYAIAQPDYDIVLLQQPEVHLHPRAQAGLGSLLLAASEDKIIVTETHSDYIIDRVRVDLRKSGGRIDPENIAIYYFEREGPRVVVQRIRLDEHGNILNPPRGYRRFFIQHENTLLGLDNVSDH